MMKRDLSEVPKEKSLEKKNLLLQTSLIIWLLVIAALVLFFCQKSRFWPGGVGIGKNKSVTTESVEKDAKGGVVKTVETTKHDDGKTLWEWLSLLGVPLSLAILGFFLQQNQQKRSERVDKEQKNRDEIFAKEQKNRDEKFALEQQERDIKAVQEQRERDEKVAKDQRERDIKAVQDQRERDEKVAKDQRERDIKAVQDQRERDEKVAKDQREMAAEETKEEILQSYFDRLSVLLIDNNLFAIAAKVYPTVMPVILPVDHPKIEATLEERELFYSAVEFIRARTLSTLRRFENDRQRKTSVIRFLIEADIIRLLEINLKDADLSRADLEFADLSNAYLNYANLSRADLNYANLSRAHLMFANLSGAKLYKADLRGADLRVANLSGAELYEADLRGTDLESAADLSGAIFRNNPGLSDAAKANMREYGAIFMN